MAALDSKAYFSEHAIGMGLTAEQVQSIKDAGWTTMGDFAFSSSAPGSANDTAFVDNVVKAVFPDASQAS